MLHVWMLRLACHVLVYISPPPVEEVLIPGPAALRAVVEANQPNGVTAADPNAWDSLMEGLALRATIDREACKAPELQEVHGGNLMEEEVAGFCFPYHGPRVPAEIIAMRQQAARLLLVRYEQSGLFDKLREVGDRRRTVRPIDDKDDRPLAALAAAPLSECRALGCVCAFRMMTAAEAGRDDEFLDAMRSCLAISRVLSHQPRVMECLISRAIEHICHGVLAVRLAQHPDEAFLQRCERVLSEQSSGVSPGYLMRSEGVIALDTIGWLFTPDRAATAKQYLPWHFEIRVESVLNRGTHQSNRAVVEKLIDKCVAVAEQTPHLRTNVDIITVLDAASHHVQMACSSMVVAAYWFDETRARRAGLKIMVALERFHAARGGYPEKLEMLVPDFFNQVPVDPWTGRPFTYRRFTPAERSVNRGYMLYCAGKDGKDNGGIEPDRSKGKTQSSVGVDLIINNALYDLIAKPTSSPNQPERERPETPDPER